MSALSGLFTQHWSQALSFSHRVTDVWVLGTRNSRCWRRCRGNGERGHFTLITEHPRWRGVVCWNPCPQAATCPALTKQRGCKAAAEIAGELPGAREPPCTTAAPRAWHPAASTHFWVGSDGREQPECCSVPSKPRLCGVIHWYLWQPNASMRTGRY